VRGCTSPPACGLLFSALWRTLMQTKGEDQGMEDKI
jgi:hypothetical protein